MDLFDLSGWVHPSLNNDTRGWVAVHLSSRTASRGHAVAVYFSDSGAAWVFDGHTILKVEAGRIIDMVNHCPNSFAMSILPTSTVSHLEAVRVGSRHSRSEATRASSIATSFGRMPY